MAATSWTFTGGLSGLTPTTCNVRLGRLAGDSGFAAPTLSTDGVSTQRGEHFAIGYKVTGGTSADFSVYLWYDQMGYWISAESMAATQTIDGDNTGGVVLVKTYADRVAVAITNLVGSPTAVQADVISRDGCEE